MTICTRCGDIKPDDGFKLCRICRYKLRLHNKAYLNGCDYWDCDTCPHSECVADVEKSLKRRKDASRRSYAVHENHNKKGLCRMCNEPLSSRSKYFCDKHLAAHNLIALKQNRARYVRRIRDEKLCFLCQKVPHLKDKKICENCYQVVTSNLAKGRFTQQQRRLSLKFLVIHFLSEKRREG